MTQVTVRRCVLRVRRTSGWAWGASPDALLQAASRALPEVVAARLPAIAAAATQPIHVVAPVRVRVAASLAELADLAMHGGGRNGHAASRTALGDRVAAAIEAVLAPRLATTTGA